MTTLILARHGLPMIERNTAGETIAYTYDVPLVKLGQENIIHLAKKLQERGVIPTRILTSPATRTVESAKVFSTQFGLPPPIIDNDLRDVEGPTVRIMTYKELEKVGGEVYPREVLEALDIRARETIKRIVTEYPEETVVVFSHGDFIRVARQRLTQPDGPIPPMKEMSLTDYLDTGEAWVVRFNDKGIVEQIDFVGQNTDIPQGRIYP